MSDSVVVLAFVVVIVCILALLVGVCVIASHYEAKAFNEVTGLNITTRQAFFLKLRVIEPVKTDSLTTKESF